MNHSFCHYLENALMVSPTSEVRPCCRFDTSRYTVQDFIWDQKSPLAQFYKGAVFQQLRLQSRNGERVAGCHRCYREEELGIASMRQKAFPTNIPATDIESPRITFVELGAGRICNLKCRSCDPYFSTKWDDDAKEVQKPLPDKKLDIDLDQMDVQFFKHTTAMKVTGGEPFFNPSFERLLLRVVESGYAQNINLEIFSNATRSPSPRMVEILKSFRQLGISLSIDAHSDRNSYIRHPSRWEEVEKTCRFWREQLQKHIPMQLCYAVTVSIFNIYYLFDLFEWLYELDAGPEPEIIIQSVQDPIHLNVALWPLEVRKAIDEQFQKKKLFFQARYKPQSSFLKRLMKIEKMLHAKESTNSVAGAFWRETNILDKKRKEVFEETFPELYKVLSFTLDKKLSDLGNSF